MSMHTISVIVAILTIAFSSFRTFATSSELSRANFKVNTGIGYSNVGLTALADIDYQRNNRLFSLHFVGSWEEAISQYSFDNDLPFERTIEISALYGHSFVSDKPVYASISSGLGIVTGVRRGEYLYKETEWFPDTYYRADEFTTIGLPVQCRFFWTPLSFLGIGITGFANLNVKYPYGGAALSFLAGK